MKEKLKKMRADELLVLQGLVDTRSRAKTLIMMGKVFCGIRKIDKAGDTLSPDSSLHIKEDIPYVSRGGLKLEAALRHFSIDVKDKIAIDVGASTGGFTDCLLKYGAAKVYAIDVGHGILDSALSKDPRVVNIEKTNIRIIDPEIIPEKADIAVIDVSFISLSKIMLSVLNLLKPQGVVIALIKPQFELTPKDVGKGGIVRDDDVRQKAVDNVKQCMITLNLSINGIIPSPIKGQKGNQEYLIYALLGTRD
jgi:23S rRNA (cytidine1920-2'-O)/16S rRNA (cytidine1409-2'-O)-methyltransferase